MAILVGVNVLLEILTFTLFYVSLLFAAHGAPIRFNSLQQKHDAISEHANALDATREKGSDWYEMLLAEM